MTARRTSKRHLTHHDNATSLALYDAAAAAAASHVIATYSTSFAVTSRMLTPAARAHIASVYAMVRVADEVVDTYRGTDARAQLDGLEREVLAAMEGSFSTNLVAHAFGVAARECGISSDLTAPFFASMRMDLDTVEHTQASFDRYVYGSAEVIGEMCVAVFFATEGRGAQPSAEVREGARRLGAAYQKVNFLRDLAMDDGDLGRSYFPGVTTATLTDDVLAALVDDVRADIRAAEACVPALPRRARIAVTTTIDIYSRLLRAIERTPADRLARTRIRVPDPIKVGYAFRNACPGLSSTRRMA